MNGKQNSRGYVEAAYRLFRYAETNRRDSEFGRTKELVYVFDTSLLAAYWQRDPLAAGGQYGIGNLLRPSAALYSGWLTLKFLVEQKLPGASTAYISPDHWNEAMELVEQDAHKMKDEFFATSTSKFEVADAKLKELLQEVDTNVDMGDQAEMLFARANDEGVGRLFQLIMEAVSYRDRVKRVFDNGRDGNMSVRDLNSCAKYWGPLHDIRHEDFRYWLRLVAKHRRAINQERAKHSRVTYRTGPATRNNVTDALTLATMQAMYRANPEACGTNPTVRFLFVTPDAAVHAAYEEFMAENPHSGLPDFLRHPHVYAPLINHANMAPDETGEDDGGIPEQTYDDIESALDQLLGTSFVGTNVGGQSASGLPKSLMRNVDRWSRQAQQFCLANSHSVLSDIGAQYASASEVAALLSSPDIRRAAVASLTAEVEEIRTDHSRAVQELSLVEALDGARDEAIKLGKMGRPQRAPLKLLDIDIQNVLGLHGRRYARQSDWLAAVLAAFRTENRTEVLEEVVGAMRATLKDNSRIPAAQLLASCIYFAVGAWSAARECAYLCRDGLENGVHKRGAIHRQTWTREANYCEALAIRMQFRSSADIKTGINLLNQNLANPIRGLAEHRDRVERATLILTVIVVQILEDMAQEAISEAPFINLLPGKKILSEFEDAVSDLNIVLAKIDDFLVEDSFEMANQIRVQATINLLGASIFRELLSERLAAATSEALELERALANLNETLLVSSHNTPLSARIYIEMAKTLLRRDEATIEHALALFDSDPVRDAELSHADRAEIAFFRTRLEEMREAVVLNVPLQA